VAEDFRAFRRILESVGPDAFTSLQDLGHAIRYGELKDDRARAGELVNRAFDLNGEEMARRLLEATLGTHLINRTAFDQLTPARRIRLLRMAVIRGRESGVSGYRAGAFVIGSLVDPGWPAGFWERFRPDEVASLLDEWVLHQKYLHLLDEVGETRLSRAKNAILSRGLSALPLPPGAASEFGTLRESRMSLNDIRAALAANADPQTRDLIDLLRGPSPP
jgi:hypothetical protein